MRRILSHPQEYGISWNTLPDLTFEPITGWECLAQDVVWRLQTDRGTLFYDSTYGLNIRKWLHSVDSDEMRFDIETSIEAELEKDPRILEASVSVTQVLRDQLDIELQLETADGPFQLIISATEYAVLLKGGDT